MVVFPKQGVTTNLCVAKVVSVSQKKTFPPHPPNCTYASAVNQFSLFFCKNVQTKIVSKTVLLLKKYWELLTYGIFIC